MANSNSKTERKKTFKMQWNATTSNATRVFFCSSSPSIVAYALKPFRTLFLCSLHTTRTRLDERVYRNNKSLFFWCIIFAHNEERSTNFNDDSDERATAIFIRCFLCSAFLSSFHKNSNYDAKQGYLFHVFNASHKEERVHSISDAGLSVISLSLILCLLMCTLRTAFSHTIHSQSFIISCTSGCSPLHWHSWKCKFMISTSTIDMLNDFSFSYSPPLFHRHLALSSGYMRPPPLICHFHTANLGIGLKIVT